VAVARQVFADYRQEDGGHRLDCVLVLLVRHGHERRRLYFDLGSAHRRVRASSLLDYPCRDDQQRRQAADELSALTQEIGLV